MKQISLKIKRESEKGRRLTLSLPLPPFPVQVSVPSAIAWQVIPLGEWPARALFNTEQMWPWAAEDLVTAKPFGNPPRRCLVTADFPGDVPEECEILLSARSSETLAHAGSSVSPVPRVRACAGEEYYQKRNDNEYHYVRREDSIEIVTGKATSVLRLGMACEDRIRYWQWVEVKPVWEGNISSAYSVCGHIYAGSGVDRPLTMDEVKNVEKLTYFQESTVAAKAFLVVYNDGSLEVSTHFINVQGYGRADIAYGEPVIELQNKNLRETADFRISEGTAEWGTDAVWRWKPMPNKQIFIGRRQSGGAVLPSGELEDQFVNKSDRGLVKGAARSFCLRMTHKEQNMLPVRFLAPPSWYMRCSEYGLPLHGDDSAMPDWLRELTDLCAEVFPRNIHPEGMSRGGVYRYLDGDQNGRFELSLDGNEAALLFRAAYLRSSQELYEIAMEAARSVADIGVDHRYFNVHYHGDTSDWSLFSLIYLRFAGLVHVYLETGDPWYLETAEGVANRWIAVNRQNQPRKNMGRDTEPVEGIMMLYDATGKDHYFQEAHKIAEDVARSLFPDKSWRSGFGVGPFWGVNALKGTAWNGSHLLAGIAEFLFRATPRTCGNYNELLEKAVDLIWGILKSVDEEYDGFHRTSCSYLMRRGYLIAHLANDVELKEALHDLFTRLQKQYEKDGDEFFKAGHHCAGYLEAPHVYAMLSGTSANFNMKS